MTCDDDDGRQWRMMIIIIIVKNESDNLFLFELQIVIAKKEVFNDNRYKEEKKRR